MTKKQTAAAIRLNKAIDACHRAGLRGGVYEYSFRVWPVNANPQPHDEGMRFFESIEEIGMTLTSRMLLDGGSGT